MQTVWARDWHSIIKWEKDGDGVGGTYAEYSHEYTCTVTEGDTPVGKVNYRQVWYRKHGKSIAEAENSQPQATEAFDTDEYFSYIHGKWQ